MKTLILSLLLLLFTTAPIQAAPSPTPSPQVKGLYDEELEYSDTYTASPTATPRPTASSSARTTKYLDSSNAPVSGSTETTIILLLLGFSFILAGIKFSRKDTL